MSHTRLRLQHLALGLSAVLLFIGAGPLRPLWVHGQTLGSRSVQLRDSTAGATTDYTLSFSGQSVGGVGSIRAQFCSNDPLIGFPCTPPNGFSLSGAVLTAQSGMGGFTINTASSTTSTLVLSRTPAPSVPGTSIYTLNGIINPSLVGSAYIRIETYASADATGVHTDYGGLVFSMTNNVSINTYVPPYLLFCTGTAITAYDCATASGDYIDFGEFRTTATAIGKTQMLVATNAGNGYTVRAVGTTLTSGNNEITSMSTSDVARTGISQFGLNLRVNGTPAFGNNAQGPGSGTAASGYNTPDFYKFLSGEVIASSTGPEGYRLYTSSYIVNISKNQSPGVYVSTITYVSLANF